MIKIIKTRDFNVKLKATIHSSGRLGFTADTAKSLNLSPSVYVRFAKDDEEDKALYIILSTDSDEDSFKITKAGAYYYLPTSLMFESLGYDYKKFNIIFDMVRMSNLDELLGGQVYKLNKRVFMRKGKKNKE